MKYCTYLEIIDCNKFRILVISGGNLMSYFDWIMNLSSELFLRSRYVSKKNRKYFLFQRVYITVGTRRSKLLLK